MNTTDGRPLYGSAADVREYVRVAPNRLTIEIAAVHRTITRLEHDLARARNRAQMLMLRQYRLTHESKEN